MQISKNKIARYVIAQLKSFALLLCEIATYVYVQFHIFYDKLFTRKVVIFYLPIVGQISYILPLKQELTRSSTRFSFYLCVDAGFEKTEKKLEILKIPNRKIFNLKKIERLTGIDVFLSATQWIPYSPKSKYSICIFHGQPSKGNTFLPQYIKKFNSLFLLGPLQKSLYEEFARMYPDIACKINAFNIGYPKSDALINGEYSRDKVLTDLRLNLSKKTVLLAPAFDNGTSLHMYGREIVQKLVELDLNVLVKLHPMSYDRTYCKIFTGGVYWPEVLKCFEVYQNFRLINNEAIDPLLAASDVMVTDVSGVALEFIVLDRPVVYIHSSDFFNKTLFSNDQMYMADSRKALTDIRANAGRSAGIVVEDINKLKSAVLHAVTNPMEFSQKRKNISEQLLYNPGSAAVIAANTLVEMLSINSRRKSNKKS